MKLSEGQELALRRDALGLTQTDLAKVVDVSLSTVSRAEADDPRVSRAMKSALWRAIEKAEAARGSGPTLSLVVGSIEPSQDAADALKKIQAAKDGLFRIQTFLVGAAREIEAAMADLDAMAGVWKKRG